MSESKVEEISIFVSLYFPSFVKILFALESFTISIMYEISDPPTIEIPIIAGSKILNKSIQKCNLFKF